MNKMGSLLVSFFLVLLSCNSAHDKLSDGLYAEIETSKGNILLQLEFEKTPVTVANFVSLAEGKNTAVADQFKGKPFYDGLKFHRVIANFMIQGGDPDGNGSGGPGYKFKDEIVPDLKMDKAGVLAMANSGPSTNGSQFFITHNETNYLNGRHTVFGNVVTGQDVVDMIAQDDEIIKVNIIRKGEKAKKFDAQKVFKNYFDSLAEEAKAAEAKTAPFRAEKTTSFADLKKSGTKTASGLIYKIIQKGSGKKLPAGTNVFVHYAGYFENGTLFDTSFENLSKQFGQFNQQKASSGGYQPFPFQIGQKEGLIPGFIEGLEKITVGEKAIIFVPSKLAYGAQGAGGVIPPNTDLFFELEMLDKLPTK
jgi:peptidyl-prolyl cis-trans isomerase A (cyclophilin A)